MALIERILVPTDFSPCAQRALTYATELARGMGAALVLLHVYQPPTVYPPEGVWTMPVTDADMAVEIRKGLDRLVTELGEAGLPAVSAVVRDGDAAHEIVDAAAAERADLVVMGTHGRGPVKHLLLGSVAEKVVRRCGCPVLTVGPHVDVPA